MKCIPAESGLSDCYIMYEVCHALGLATTQSFISLSVVPRRVYTEYFTP